MVLSDALNTVSFSAFLIEDSKRRKFVGAKEL